MFAKRARVRDSTSIAPKKARAALVFRSEPKRSRFHRVVVRRRESLFSPKAEKKRASLLRRSKAPRRGSRGRPNSSEKTLAENAMSFAILAEVLDALRGRGVPARPPFERGGKRQLERSAKGAKPPFSQNETIITDSTLVYPEKRFFSTKKTTFSKFFIKRISRYAD